MSIKSLSALLIPPILLQGRRAWPALFRREKPPGMGLSLTGDYASWAEATAASTGYDDEIILEKTKEALLKVKRGEAVYERDSVLFGEVQYAWPVLAGLMWAAARSGGDLNVLDFGGALGSTYFQNRAFLKGLRGVRWNVVEQTRHVEFGRECFQDDQLRFYGRVEDCLAETRPNVIVMSGVLQYLENPCRMLERLLNCPCDHLVVDRTAFWDGPSDRLCVQHVPAEIYPASYPSWILSRERFLACLNAHWEIVAEFDSLDRIPGPVELAYRGMIITRRKPVEAER